MVLDQIVGAATLILEYVGVLVILYGAALGIVALLEAELGRHTARSRQAAIDAARRKLAHRIIFGLDIFIARDILQTVLVPGQAELIRLGAIVAIRVVLDFFLRKEIKE
jgi:uncharacterized membrane protein